VRRSRDLYVQPLPRIGERSAKWRVDMQFLFLCFIERRDGNVAVAVNSQVHCAARDCGIVHRECEIVPASPSSIRSGVVDVGSRNEESGAVCASLERGQTKNDERRRKCVSGRTVRFPFPNQQRNCRLGWPPRAGSGYRRRPEAAISQWRLFVGADAPETRQEAADTSSPRPARGRDGVHPFITGDRAIGRMAKMITTQETGP
jgi:hypothetical protein